MGALRQKITIKLNRITKTALLANNYVDVSGYLVLANFSKRKKPYGPKHVNLD